MTLGRWRRHTALLERQCQEVYRSSAASLLRPGAEVGCGTGLPPAGNSAHVSRAERRDCRWERDAAEPGHAVARDAVLLDAIELLLHARKEQVSAGRKSEATFGFYREKTGHWLRVLGEDFPLARLSGTDVDRYITHRRSEWSVPPRDPVLDEEMFSSRRERAGM